MYRLELKRKKLEKEIKRMTIDLQMKAVEYDSIVRQVEELEKEEVIKRLSGQSKKKCLCYI